MKCAPAKIACIGEVMIELVAQKGAWAKLGVAGDTYNTAVYLRHLLPPDSFSVYFVTALGVDSHSDRMLDSISEHGIETGLISRRQDLHPGLYAIDTDETGERSFSYWRENSAARTLFQPADNTFLKLGEFDLLYLSGISLAILPADIRTRLYDFLSGYRSRGGKVAYDSNFRPALWNDVETARQATMAMWSLTDIALPSFDDEMALFGDTQEQQVLDRLKGAGVNFGAMKRGQAGPLAIGYDTKKQNFCAVSNIVDTTAAGDSFNAGFLSAYLQGRNNEEALTQGHNLAAKVIQAPGAIVEL